MRHDTKAWKKTEKEEVKTRKQEFVQDKSGKRKRANNTITASSI